MADRAPPMTKESVRDAIMLTMQSDNDKIKQGEALLKEYMSFVAFPFVALDIYDDRAFQHVRNGVTIYLSKSTKDMWTLIDFDKRAELRQRFMESITSNKLSDAPDNYIESISRVLKRDETSWPDLVHFVFDLCENLDRLIDGYRLFIEVIRNLTSEVFDEHLEQLIGFARALLANKQDPITLILASSIIVTIFDKSQSEFDITDCIDELINQIGHLNNSPDSDFKRFWDNIEILCRINGEYGDVIALNDKQLKKLTETVVREGFISDLYRLNNILGVISCSANRLGDYALPILVRSVHTNAAIIAENEALDSFDGSVFESFAHVFTPDKVYKMYMHLVNDLTEKDSESMFAVGILILPCLITECPEFIEVKKFVDLITTSLSSGSSLVYQAGCIALQHFSKGSRDLSQELPRFIGSLMSFLNEESIEIRHSTYLALGAVFENLAPDSPNLITPLLSFMSSLKKDDCSRFLDLVALVIDKSSVLETEESDQIYNLLDFVARFDDIMIQASSLDVAVSLAKRDETQIGAVYQMFFPIATNLLSSMNFNCIKSAFDFIGCVANQVEETGNLVQMVLNVLNESECSSDVKGSGYICFARLCKNETSEEFLEVILDDFEYVRPQFLMDELDALCIHGFGRNPEIQTSFLRKLVERSIQEIGVEVWEKLLQALNQLIEESVMESEVVMETCRPLATKIADGSLDFFHENENISKLDYIPKICYLFGTFLKLSSPFYDIICEYLFTLLKDDNEIVRSNVIGALIDIFFSDLDQNIKAEVITEILKLLPTASIASMRQNIVYFLNVVVKHFDNPSDILNSSLDYVAKWKIQEESHESPNFDLLSNIGSLYLSICMAFGENEDFPFDDLFVSGLSYFPPIDKEEFNPMAQAILAVLQSEPGVRHQEIIASAILRFITMDSDVVEEYDIDSDIGESLLAAFKSIIEGDQSIFDRVVAPYRKLRSKMNKITRALKA